MKKNIFHISLVLLLLTFGTASAKNKVEITISNPTAIDRSLETVELEWSTIASEGLKANSVIVLNNDGEEIPSQLIYNSEKEVECLIFQTQLAANTKVTYTLQKGKAAEYNNLVYAKMEPNRYNDFAWENDVMAYRIYHADLIPIDGPSGGIDVWSKRTTDMIIEDWFEHMDYHKDHGQGCDGYKVGPTLGAGGISLLEDGKMKKHANYTDAKIIAKGPIRLIVEFTFAKQTINGKTVAMTKTLSYDAGASLNKFEVVFTSELQDLSLVTGITKREGKGQVDMNEELGCMMYWEPEHAPNGHTGLGIIMPEASSMGTLENHVVAYGTAKADEAFTYYTGACWDKAGYFTTPVAWTEYLQNFKQQLTTPLIISVE